MKSIEPQQYCHDVCTQSGSNFVFAARFLPKKRREALEAFYAFCHLVDDAVDEASSSEEAKKNLLFWEEELERMYHGKPSHPVGKALAPFLSEWSIPKQYLAEIIAGCEMDLNQQRYESFEDLKVYCYRVASCVGIVCLYIFGVQVTEKNLQTGIELGIALQLTNIIRDVTEDLKRGRIYLPQEDLKAFGLGEKSLEAPVPQETLHLLQQQIDRAERFFLEAFSQIPREKAEQKKWLPALLMAHSYHAILLSIAKNPLKVFEEKVRLSKREKINIILRTLMKVYF